MTACHYTKPYSGQDAEHEIDHIMYTRALHSWEKRIKYLKKIYEVVDQLHYKKDLHQFQAKVMKENPPDDKTKIQKEEKLSSLSHKIFQEMFSNYHLSAGRQLVSSPGPRINNPQTKAQNKAASWVITELGLVRCLYKHQTLIEGLLSVPHTGILMGMIWPGRFCGTNRDGQKKLVVRASMRVLGSSIDRVDQGIFTTTSATTTTISPPGFEPPRTPGAQRASPPQNKKRRILHISPLGLSGPGLKGLHQQKKESYESSPDMSRPRGSKDIIKTEKKKKKSHLLMGTHSTHHQNKPGVLWVFESFRPFRPIWKSKNNNKGSRPSLGSHSSLWDTESNPAFTAPDGSWMGWPNYIIYRQAKRSQATIHLGDDHSPGYREAGIDNNDNKQTT